MDAVLIRETRELPEIDAAAAWTLVGDLTRFHEWFPVRPMGDAVPALPGPGYGFSVALRPGLGPRRALRLDVVAWEAGTSYRCAVAGLPRVVDARLGVAVETRPAGRGTRVTLTFRARAEGATASLLRRRMRRRLRRALEGIARRA